MLERIFRFAIEHRLLVVLLTAATAGLGGYALQRLPIDAVPDITNKQVQINTEAAALSPVEIESCAPSGLNYPPKGVYDAVAVSSQSRSHSYAQGH